MFSAFCSLTFPSCPAFLEGCLQSSACSWILSCPGLCFSPAVLQRLGVVEVVEAGCRLVRVVELLEVEEAECRLARAVEVVDIGSELAAGDIPGQSGTSSDLQVLPWRPCWRGIAQSRHLNIKISSSQHQQSQLQSSPLSLVEVQPSFVLIG